MSNWGGRRENSGRHTIREEKKRKAYNIYLREEEKRNIERYGKGNTFSSKLVELIFSEISRRKKKIKFIDLFAGMGGIRLGLEEACSTLGIESECVLTSEIKTSALKVLKENFEHKNLVGNIEEIIPSEIEDFDILLAGFPCQPFSSAGNRYGFLDTRGTLFFNIEKILKEKKPMAFILENVEGLVTHDLENKTDKIGKTLKVILSVLKDLGYIVNWKVLDAQYFGVAQSRKRVYIVGTLKEEISLENFNISKCTLDKVLEKNLPVIESHFTSCLLKKYSLEELYGKAIKDKRGGENNIHSWDIGLKGEITSFQKSILEILFKERRRKKWAEEIGIKWMDGMPLTLEQIHSFIDCPISELEKELTELTKLGYLKLEFPKKEIILEDGRKKRVYAEDKKRGYNIVAGKLSFEFTKILDPREICPTLVAMDVDKIGVVDEGGIRKLSLREGLRLCGYPENYSLDIFDKDINSRKEAFDLLGNTVVVPVIRNISERLLKVIVE